MRGGLFQRIKLIISDWFCCDSIIFAAAYGLFMYAFLPLELCVQCVSRKNILNVFEIISSGIEVKHCERNIHLVTSNGMKK